MRIFAGFLVVVVQEGKRALLGVRKVVIRLKHELTTWQVDE